MEPRDAALIGTSVAIQRVREDVACAARADAKVLITGEPGLGKESLCRHIHAHSRRSGAPFVTLDCGDVPERELTSALADKIPIAAGGTLFLENVDAIGADAQTQLLQFLECAARPLNLRVNAASSRNLYERVSTQEFRADLYYRLNVLHIDIPPLRERREDVPALVRHFLDVFSRHNTVPTPVVSDGLMGAFQHHEWPGNIRELRDVIRRAAADWATWSNDPRAWINSPSRRMCAIPSARQH